MAIQNVIKRKTKNNWNVIVAREHISELYVNNMNTILSMYLL